MEFRQQYDLVKSSRKVLLNYCGTLPDETFLARHPAFGRGCIRGLLVHNLNAYEWWIGAHALGSDSAITDNEAILNLRQIIRALETTDAMVGRFCERYTADSFAAVPASLGEKQFMSTPIELFTHAITHEFHHKGQLLWLTRLRGHVPADTDIIR